MSLLQLQLRRVQGHLRPLQGGGDIPAAVTCLLGILLGRGDSGLQFLLTLLRRLLRFGQLLVGGAEGIGHLCAQRVLLFLLLGQQLFALLLGTGKQLRLSRLGCLFGSVHFGPQLFLPLLSGCPNLTQLLLRGPLGCFHVRLNLGNLGLSRLLRGVHLA